MYVRRKFITHYWSKNSIFSRSSQLFWRASETLHTNDPLSIYIYIKVSVCITFTCIAILAKGIRISKLASKMLIIISYLTKHKSKVGNLSLLRFGASRLPYINFVNLFAKHCILRLMIILCLPRYHLCFIFFFFLFMWVCDLLVHSGPNRNTRNLIGKPLY